MNRKITYTRSNLFDLVWSTPILKLAKEVGISDVALAKACRRVNIPLPGRRHWAKSDSRRPKQLYLPKYTGAGSGDVSFSSTGEPSGLAKPQCQQMVLSAPTRLPDANEDGLPYGPDLQLPSSRKTPSRRPSRKPATPSLLVTK